MFFVSCVKGSNIDKRIGVTDTSDGVEDFFSMREINKYRTAGIPILGVSMCLCRYRSKLLNVLKPYEGRTPSESKYGMLSYWERIQYALEELLGLIGERKSEGSIIDYIVANSDFEYDDCYIKYEGMVILRVNKNDLNTLYWYPRED